MSNTPEFKEANITLAENQPEYTPLEINVNPELPTVPMTAMFHFTDEDIEKLKSNGGVLYYTQLTFGNQFQPISIGFDKPETLSKLTRDELLERFK